ncbi:MAG: hypothetical protein MK077_08875 [Phycisphaerales bacterium]|nr:hypothetical protein [Phycisphaerales bacterium]
MPCHPADLADALAKGLDALESAYATEQAVTGLDALDEVALHPLLAEVLTKAGYGVHREQRYISQRSKRKASAGRRCDLVITPEGRALQDPEASKTLFEDPNATPLSEAYWLEVKTVAQFTSSGPNRAWASELLSTVSKDVAKLARDQRIFHAGLLILLWTADIETAQHDLSVWEERCLLRNLPIGMPAQRHIKIQDRLGNACGVISLYPVRHSSPRPIGQPDQ